MFKFIKKDKEEKSIILKSPIVGRCFDMSEMPDEMFSKKLLGDGVGFESTDGILYAPVDGEILQVFPTKHALILRTKEGIEILLHIGIDTLQMKGEGFEAFTEKGNQVKVGDKLLTFDNELIKAKVKSNLSVLIVTNNNLIESIDIKLGTVDKDNEILKIRLKK
ncbi:PTS sugar transporter subunit IIA [Clostridium estertheticum]|uniref:PTS glucose transporter subunit IIA n=1 Tax=Clostridium estertheticum TaxID=238834 RepID=A0A7Y3SYP2_9CLOT|nr:PTS glucose transporter subunit IIA [Clostridium estertheticum]MBX4263273.1 PTS glucose transporter subunit IIA [Clostridium estertheticum]MBX4270694.1 PTS glucose transporter subunit IIA [Clostridium estertheticum]NNU77784.1 PTS glucose transporter subunit IIA [Clostridium estertheticum]WBL45513.1 PTS glucose transporter subunit IIA [Clostridium estertheticum]WLC78544.1 PTS glucose transporter subunit IIA [Clostridium estertheticum]